MKNKETVCQEALRLLEPIPEDKWLTYRFTNDKDSCCAIGHYYRLKSKDTKDYSIGNCMDSCSIDGSIIRKVSYRFLKSLGVGGLASIYEINNGDKLYRGLKCCTTPLYHSMSPKQRVILFLKDAVKAGY